MIEMIWNSGWNSGWIGVGVVGVIGVMIVTYLQQDRLLYFPSIPPGARSNFFHPSAFGLSNVYHERMIPTSDGETLQTWCFVNPNRYSSTLPTIIFFHGNAGNISYRLEFVRQFFHYIPCHFVLVEYRGYGKSSGSASEKKLQEDALTVMRHIQSLEWVDASKIVLMGRSLGGAVALHLATQLEQSLSTQSTSSTSTSSTSSTDIAAAVIVENTFTSIPEMVPHVIPLLRYLPSFCITNKWNNLAEAAKIRTPLLVISGQRDTLVPPYMSRHIAEAAVNSSRRLLRTFPTGEHMDTWLQPNYYDTVREFLASIFPDNIEYQERQSTSGDSSAMRDLNEEEADELNRELDDDEVDEQD